MKSSSLWSKTLAVALIVGIQLLVSPAPAATPPAALSGQIVSVEERAPVQGVVVQVLDSGTGDLYTSEPTDDKGAFAINALPASAYSVAVQKGEGVYLAGSTVVLAPGEHRAVQVAIYDNGEPPSPGLTDDKKYKMSGWNNPLVATLIALGIAVVVGYGVQEIFGTDSKKKKVSSPVAP